jgi:hypothetical protein
MQSISRTREVKDSAERYERILEAEGMPAEFPNEERISFVALDDEVVAAGPEESDGDAAEDGALRPRADGQLSSADVAVVEWIKAAGWAGTPEEVGAHPDQIERLADAGVAYLRACGKRVVLAMAGATAGDVRRAAARLESRERGTGERPERGCTHHEELPEELAAEILRRLERRGGVVEERTLAVSLRDRPPRLRRAALALLAGRGEVRKIRCRSSGTTLVVLASTSRSSVARELRRVADLKAALAEERRESMKPHASEVERVGGRPVAKWLVGFRCAVSGDRLKPGQVRELIRRELPFRVGLHDALGEDDEIEEWQRSHARRREENAWTVRRDLAAGIVPGPCGVPPAPHWTEDPGLRRRVEAQLRTGQATRNTARAIYVFSLPTLAHKVLHLLRRDGRQPQERFVALASAQDPANDRPEELLEEAVRELGEAGKVRRMRSRKTGRVYLEATEGLDVSSYERDLSRIVRSERHRIPTPRVRQRAASGQPHSVSSAVPGASDA